MGLSPQGDRIAYMRDGDLTTVRPDGSDVTDVAQLPGWYGTQIDWAPDGSALVASTNGIWVTGSGGTGPSTWQLAVVAADGSALRMVDVGPNTSAGRGAWRPDGRLIAFVGYTKPPNTRAVFIADRDGTNVRKISGAGDVASDGLAWSPDGTRLSFMRYRADRAVEIAVLEVDPAGAVTGSTSFQPQPPIPARLSEPPVTAELTPSWSPDGTQLAYALVDGASVRVGIVAPDGSGSRIIDSTAGASAADLEWSPDGRSLVIVDDHPEGDGLMSWLIDLATGEEAPAGVHIGDWLPLAP